MFRRQSREQKQFAEKKRGKEGWVHRNSKKLKEVKELERLAQELE